MCKYYAFLYKGLEHPGILVTAGVPGTILFLPSILRGDCISIWKEEIKLPLFVDNMIVYRGNSKEFKVLEITWEFSKVTIK